MALNLAPTWNATKVILCDHTLDTYLATSWQSTPGYQGYQPWYSDNFVSLEQQLNQCQHPYSYIVDNNSPTTHYGSVGQLCGSGSTNMEVKAAPGVAWWDGGGNAVGMLGCIISTTNATLTFDSGAVFSNGSCSGGVAAICAYANGVTISGPGASIVNTTAHLISGNPNWSGLTVAGGVGNPLTLRCKDHTSIPASDGILTSGNQGLITISHVAIDHCGGSGGTDHGIYLSWGGNPVNDVTYCHAINDLLVTNSSIGAGPSVKFDDPCETSPGTLTNSAIIDCTDLSACEAGVVYDQQCGGHQTATNLLLEYFGTNNGDPDELAKLGWGAIGMGGCMNFPTSGTNSTSFDKGIFIFDGVLGISSLGSPVVACGSAYDSTDGVGCNANAAGDATTSTSTLTIGQGYQVAVIPATTSFAPGNVVGGRPLTFTASGNSISAITVPIGLNPSISLTSTFTASITGTQMTVTAVPFSSPGVSQCGNSYLCPITVGQTITSSTNNDVTAHTYLVSLDSGGVTSGREKGSCTQATVPCVFTVSASQSVGSEVMGATSRDFTTNVTAIHGYGTVGSGTFSSWAVNFANHDGVCVTNSEIIADFSNYTTPTMMRAGPGVYTDTGCTTSSGTDSNTYYGGLTGTSGGRLNACSVLKRAGADQSTDYGWNNCNTSPNLAGAWPYVPDYTKNPPSLAIQATAATEQHCTGAGTAASPYTACDAP